MKKPVILLAFANEIPVADSYLRNLRLELRGITKVLEKAVEEELCEIKVLTNTTLEDLFDVLQHPNFRDRIAIFHFAGHAHSLELILEDEQGRAKAIAATKFFPLLGQLRSLKLVFLNGCSTTTQARMLIESGVPSVIGTV